MLALASMACGREPPQPTQAGNERLRPGPAPQRRPADVANADCVRCHQDIAAEWQGSLHRRAWDDPTFLAAYAVEPLSFCRRCHAPEAMAGADDPRRHEGVSCVTCHVLQREVLGPAAANNQHHATVATPAMRTASWCGGCHEFDFPRPQAAKMQSTLSEHARSRWAERSCQDCHMPRVEGPQGSHRRHDFRVQGDHALMASALTAQAAVLDARRVEVTLRAADVGHDVPTGDLYRRLVVRGIDASGQRARPVVLARRFARRHHQDGDERVQVGDDRVPADGSARTAELFFLAPYVLPLRWEVVYQRMGPREAAVFGVDVGAEEVVVAGGSVPKEKRTE